MDKRMDWTFSGRVTPDHVVTYLTVSKKQKIILKRIHMKFTKGYFMEQNDGSY